MKRNIVWLVEKQRNCNLFIVYCKEKSTSLFMKLLLWIVIINHIFLSSNSQVQNHLHPLSKAKLRQGISRHFKPMLPNTCHKSLTLSSSSPVLLSASRDLWCRLHVGPAEARWPAGDHSHQEGGFPHTDPVLLLHGEVRMINMLFIHSLHTDGSQGSFYSRYRVKNKIFMSVH